MQLYALWLPEFLPAAAFAALQAKVSGERRAAAARYRRRADAQRTLAGEWLSRLMLAGKIGCSTGELVFKLNACGKPLLCGSYELEFNIAHAGEWVVGAVDSQPVGIDVEKLQEIDCGLLAQFFSPAEQAWLRRQPQASWLACFYEMWTLKESYLKAVGTGLNISLPSFTIAFTSQQQPYLAAGEGNWFFRQYDLDRKYRLAVCAASAEFPLEVTLLAWQEHL